MGNVLQKATDAKAELDGKKAQYKVDENKSEFMKLKHVIAETTGAPVLGPFICLAFHVKHGTRAVARPHRPWPISAHMLNVHVCVKNDECTYTPSTALILLN